MQAARGWGKGSEAEGEQEGDGSLLQPHGVASLHDSTRCQQGWGEIQLNPCQARQRACRKTRL
jgi:hypothetical protein